MRPVIDFIKRLTVVLSAVTAWSCVTVLFLWAVGAVYYCPLLPALFKPVIATVYLTGGIVLFFRSTRKQRWLRNISVSIVVVYVFTLFQRPSLTRSWAEDNAVTPNIQIDGDQVLVSGLRHSQYRSETDFDVYYRDVTFRLSQLDKVWFVVQRFTTLEGIAHNFLTFAINGETETQFVSVSVEIRREIGETFSPLKGLYREYELIYVIADERDEIGARTVFRPDDRVYMYPVNANPRQVQQLFKDIAARMQQLKHAPEFYHSLLNNCTNNIVRHTYKLTPQPINWLDPRIVAPGYADRFAFSTQLIGNEADTFESLQRRCRIDTIAREAGITSQFSADIRRTAIVP